ncbi:NACHT C-terminal helical domain 2-containing protein [Pleurocapsa sp. FMAR1]|uniref:NACHT C-terminal helical domain 2-containing protein n=1 Tax=Pleurocapsa sp. FMAR1 TaxID=3040204 RepID=UPI0029C88B4B|nr:hypothetical protein [Pleurocapsa sp. FMAR1]
MPKSQLVSTHELIFDTLLDNLLLQFSISSIYSCNLVQAHACIDALIYAIDTVLDVGSKQPLQLFKDQIPNLRDRSTHKLRWCQVEYLVWIEELKTAVSLYRKMQSCWNFTSERKILEQYYNVNKFLIDCLDHHYGITIELRQKIETALLFSDKQPIER